MNILCVGDIFARPGREILKAQLPALIRHSAAEYVIVNGENASGGRGVSAKNMREFLALPIHTLTSGNHIWQREDIRPFLDTGEILRPHNAPDGRPGSGVIIGKSKSGVAVGVVNLQGRANMFEGEQCRNPFHVADELVSALRKHTPIIVVDFHAQTTSEKKALAWYLDGRISCLFGTHTHVQTADEQILPGGTAYITDIGMTGPHRSVIGARAEDAIKRFLTDGKEKRWKAADEGVALQGICVTVDTTTGRATHIERLHIPAA
ncbi:MAG: YmdB family metallophosphoesterase [Deltaproteobacteria bacterium]|nr:YmdB family metallophosphoesterase [Deltaproteobacteria bacterium]